MGDKQPSESINFPDEEEAILELWKKLDVFKNCLKQSKGKPRYSFYDGPPFATGLPHYGHLLAGTIKDIVTRYLHFALTVRNGFKFEISVNNLLYLNHAGMLTKKGSMWREDLGGILMVCL